MRGKRRLFLALVLLLLFALPTTAFAQGFDGGDEVVLLGGFTLESGETIPGDLVVIGGDAEVEEDSVVEGNLMQVGGNVDLAGEVLGSLLVFGGSLDIGNTAIVHGDIAHMGGNIDISPRAEIMGTTRDSGSLMIPFIFGSDSFLPDEDFGEFNFGDFDRFEFADPGRLDFSESFGPFGPRIPRFNMDGFVERDAYAQSAGIFGSGGPLQEFLWLVLQAFFYAVLAVLIVLFIQRPAERVRRAAVRQPFLAGGLGILTFVLAIPLLILLAITILLIPVSFAVFVVLLAMGIFGWVAVGMEVGHRLGIMFKRDWHPALAAGIGVLTLSLAEAALWQIPCIGFLTTLLIASIGLGAIWLTRFGTREYEVDSDLPAEIE